eukprot:5798859-Pleurochrysis_carterae.AAC.1
MARFAEGCSGAPSDLVSRRAGEREPLPNTSARLVLLSTRHSRSTCSARRVLATAAVTCRAQAQQPSLASALSGW